MAKTCFGINVIKNKFYGVLGVADYPCMRSEWKCLEESYTNDRYEILTFEHVVTKHLATIAFYPDEIQFYMSYPGEVPRRIFDYIVFSYDLKIDFRRRNEYIEVVRGERRCPKEVFFYD